MISNGKNKYANALESPYIIRLNKKAAARKEKKEMLAGQKIMESIGRSIKGAIISSALCESSSEAKE